MTAQTDTPAPLAGPLTPDEIRARLDAEGYLTGDITVSLDDVIDLDLEGFVDLCSDRLVGSPLLMAVEYTAVGVHTDGSLIIRVTGDPDAVLDDDD